MKIKFLTVAITLFLLFSCKKDESKDLNTNAPTDTVTTTDKTEKATEPKEDEASNGIFDVNTIPVAQDLKGSFPYFKLPEGYTYTDPNKYHGAGVTKNIDMEYFYNHGTYFAEEGQTYKAVIRIESDNSKFKDKEFSALEITRSFDEFIAGLGGKKINNGEPIKSGEKDRLKNEAPNAFSDGYMHSCNNGDHVHTYVIRTKEKAVFVQYNLGAENANITILEPKAFENTMSMLPAAEIKKQLDATGKAVLYINFDTDKATLKPDGKQFVDEIKKLLQNDTALKISIEGYTDNTGTAARNKQLSEQRAQAVMKELTAGGIQAARLTAKGFGSDKPLAANDSESNKAKNRRVELIKI